MEIWTEGSKSDKRRLRAAVEHKGINIFADISPRDAVRFVAALGAALRIMQRRKQYRRAIRRKQGNFALRRRVSLDKTKKHIKTTGQRKR